MFSEQKPLFDTYILELSIRSRTLKATCTELMNSSFASQAPIVLLQTILNSCEYVEEATFAIYRNIDWSNISEQRLLKIKDIFNILDLLIKEFGQWIQYPGRAQALNVPWNIVCSLERFILNYLPGTRILISPEWHYNYSISHRDVYRIFFQYLSMLQHYYPNRSIKDVLKPLRKYRPLHIVTFPVIEKDNVLLHSLLGHEIGHLFIKDYLSKKREAAFLSSIQQEVHKFTEDVLRSKYPGIKKSIFKNQIFLDESQINFRTCTLYWRRGLEELISDFVGSIMFGPSVLFSTLEVAFQFGLDEAPESISEYYPPWRMRIREIIDTLITPGRLFFPILEDSGFNPVYREAINKRFRLIRKIAEEQSDNKTIDSDFLMKISYREMKEELAEAKNVIGERLKDKAINPRDFYAKLPYLMERLETFIPPNSFGDDPLNETPASFVEIINASWFFRIAKEVVLIDKEGHFNKGEILAKERMNRLTRKAIEYAEISENLKRRGIH